MEGGIASNRNVVVLTAIIQLVTASREQLKILDYVKTPIQVVDNLIAAVIFVADFMQKHRLVLNFSQSPEHCLQQ